MLLLLQSAFLTTDQLKNSIRVQQVLDVSINHLSDQGQLLFTSIGAIGQLALGPDGDPNHHRHPPYNSLLRQDRTPSYFIMRCANAYHETLEDQGHQNGVQPTQYECYKTATKEMKWLLSTSLVYTDEWNRQVHHQQCNSHVVAQSQNILQWLKAHSCYCVLPCELSVCMQTRVTSCTALL